MARRSDMRLRFTTIRALAFLTAASLVVTAVSIMANERSHPDIGVKNRRFIENYGTGPERDPISMNTLRRELSAAFFQSLRAAFQEDREVQAIDSTAKPPHADFTFICAGGSFDRYEIGSTRFHSATSASAVVSFVDVLHGETYRWKDRYRWILEQSDWRLDDIECVIDDPERTGSMRRGMEH
jgi:hypothetical protein